jgi:hypothetical protein
MVKGLFIGHVSGERRHVPAAQVASRRVRIRARLRAAEGRPHFDGEGRGARSQAPVSVQKCGPPFVRLKTVAPSLILMLPFFMLTRKLIKLFSYTRMYPSKSLIYIQLKS